MFATLNNNRKMIDGNTGKKVLVLRGCHEIERIKNPLNNGESWLVLKGTRTGQSESAWRILTKKDKNNSTETDFEIIIEE